MKMIFEVLKWVFFYLIEVGREENVVEFFLFYDIGMDRSKLFVSLQELIGEDELYCFKCYVEMYKEGVLVQYIIGKEFFYGWEFMVNDDVLILWLEIEEVVYYLFEKYWYVFFEDSRFEVVDVGIGSGVIVVMFVFENKNFFVLVVDILKEVL